ncbi:hypothetical protein HA075_26240 [bacterium BFN5]|nr:hypothetical protein HA075_26240 [bacterium BFN5]
MIEHPRQLKNLSLAQLEKLAGEIRGLLVHTVAKTGGHLAPNLGVVELTIALHRVFDSPSDKFVWDVGHQAYVHKILTGRQKCFYTLRQQGGLSGFPKIPREKSSNASAIVSLLRNLGGSIGISFATSILMYNRQMEQSNLVQHLSASSPGYSSSLSTYTQSIQNLGIPAAQASSKAMGQIYQQLLHQASILAYRDTFNFVAVILFILSVTALFLPSKKPVRKNNQEAA